MVRTLFSAALVGALSIAGLAYASDPSPAAPSLPSEKAAPATDAKPAAAPTPAVAPKADSPIHVMMGWIAKQVAPTLSNPCPSTADGEKAWRAWFSGGKDVPLASLRDEMVSNGFDADRFVTFFQQMVAKSKCEGGKCSEGKCSEKSAAGACEGKCDGKCGGTTADGKPMDCGCGGHEDAKSDAAKNDAATPAAPKADAAPAKPVEAPKPVEVPSKP